MEFLGIPKNFFLGILKVISPGLPLVSFYCSPKQTQQLNELAVVLAKSDWSKLRHPVLRMECCCMKEFILTNEVQSCHLEFFKVIVLDNLSGIVNDEGNVNQEQSTSTILNECQGACQVTHHHFVLLKRR